MRISLILFAVVALFMAGCSTVIQVPPQPVDVDNPEPRTIMLSEAASDLGWTYEAGPGAYDYTLRSPYGDKVIFRIGTDYMSINGARYQ